MWNVVVPILLCIQFSLFSLMRSSLKDETPICVILTYCELLKLLCSFIVSYPNRNLIFKDPKLVLPPTFCFIATNLVSYWTITKVSASTYVMFMQLKMPWTILTSWIVLGKIFNLNQNIAVILLFITCVNISNKKNLDNTSLEYLPVLGMVSETLISSLMGVYIQKVFDSSFEKTWLRNVEISCLSLPFYISVTVYNGYSFVPTLYGAIFSLLCAVGGLMVALTIMYCGAMSKIVSTSFSIILVTVAEHMLYRKVPSIQTSSFYVIGIISIIQYSFENLKQRNQIIEEESLIK